MVLFDQMVRRYGTLETWYVADGGPVAIWKGWADDVRSGSRGSSPRLFLGTVPRKPRQPED